MHLSTGDHRPERPEPEPRQYARQPHIKVGDDAQRQPPRPHELQRLSRAGQHAPGRRAGEIVVACARHCLRDGRACGCKCLCDNLRATTRGR